MTLKAKPQKLNLERQGYTWNSMKKLTYSVPIIAFLLFFVLAISTIYESSEKIETAIYEEIQNDRGRFGDYFFEAITHLFDTKLFLIMSVILFILLWGAKRKKDLLLSAAVLVGGSVIGQIMKFAFAKERPAVEGFDMLDVAGYSFPSGHALKATLFMLLLIYLYKDEIENIKWKRFFIIVCWVILILISFSRLYLGVHWIGDVLGGFLFGLGWFSLMLILFGKEK